ncbi:uncharacterized protein I303_106831 [Kwoniella dejecticola CBS 10117]|uniref:Uncharacterized protein n=1 Tax=Kwoniella dejecticola CBS 10117 TaxID=1296121 RepID=A0A1A5ZTK1_9TREE|nr:uncharacterized protein I303_08527 [Kwoniella dejecticola CBS 10117]OBR81143.1 hypothetical protein I303_08527 [Kwoniella dejecticola CBS 10117]
MTQDTKPPVPSLSPEDDLDLPPPSYDSALAASSSSRPDVGGSSSHLPPPHTSAEDRVIPQHLLHLFSGPPNGEPHISDQNIPSIEYQKNGLILQTSDPKLANPNVMYNFLRHQAMIPPNVQIRCSGQHPETSQIDQTVWQNGVQVQKKRGETYYVTDFNFTIDLSDIINHPSNNNHIHLRTIPADCTTHRGDHSLRYAASFAPEHQNTHGGYQSLDAENDYSATDVGRKSTRAEQADIDAWNLFRLKKGIPGWVKMQDMPEFWDTRAASKAPQISLNDTGDVENARRAIDDKPSLKEWCQAYCRDMGVFKEFWVLRGLYGWDMENVQTAIKNAILSTGYQSNYISIATEIKPSAIVIRPNNIFSRAINNGFIYFLSWITLIWPMIWVLKRMFPRIFGAPWNVTYINYALKCYPPLPSTYPNESIQEAQDRLASLYKLHPELPENPVLQYGPKGVHYLLGRKEGEWFREWEERIRMGVRMKFTGQLEGGVGDAHNVGQGLDGY